MNRGILCGSEAASIYGQTACFSFPGGFGAGLMEEQDKPGFSNGITLLLDSGQGCALPKYELTSSMSHFQ